jgi:hypothetical protein
MKKTGGKKWKKVCHANSESNYINKDKGGFKMKNIARCNKGSSEQ